MELKELYTKVMASDELKASFTEAAKSKETLEAWLKKQGSSATVEEVAQFLKEQSTKSGGLSDDELENVAGGTGKGQDVRSLTICIDPAVLSFLNENKC